MELSGHWTLCCSPTFGRALDTAMCLLPKFTTRELLLLNQQEAGKQVWGSGERVKTMSQAGWKGAPQGAGSGQIISEVS